MVPLKRAQNDEHVPELIMMLVPKDTHYRPSLTSLRLMIHGVENRCRFLTPCVFSLT